MRPSRFLLCLVALLNCWHATWAITSGDIYTVDSLADNAKNVSLIASLDGSVSVEQFSINSPAQRFIARTVSGGEPSTNIVNLFAEVQPWDWIDYIVESSKTVNIKDKHPQLLDVVIKDGVQTVILGDYKGENTNSHKWYVVPSGDNQLLGRIANVATRFCLVNNGPNASATVAICNNNDPNQLWRLSLRTEGRCY